MTFTKPNPAFLERPREALLERNPLLFWKGLTVLLPALDLYLLYRSNR